MQRIRPRQINRRAYDIFGKTFNVTSGVSVALTHRDSLERSAFHTTDSSRYRTARSYHDHPSCACSFWKGSHAPGVSRSSFSSDASSRRLVRPRANGTVTPPAQRKRITVLTFARGLGPHGGPSALTCPNHTHTGPAARYPKWYPAGATVPKTAHSRPLNPEAPPPGNALCGGFNGPGDSSPCPRRHQSQPCIIDLCRWCPNGSVDTRRGALVVRERNGCGRGGVGQLKCGDKSPQ